MRTARLLSYFSGHQMSVPGMDPNKFEQVSSPGHKMPLEGGWARGWGDTVQLGPMSTVGVHVQ